MSYPTFPAGTPIQKVTVVDRGQKMAFTCEQHPDTAIYHSKEPWNSSWFIEAPDMVECPCSMADPVYVLVRDYTPTRND